jgi:hypothetical protein
MHPQKLLWGYEKLLKIFKFLVKNGGLWVVTDRSGNPLTAA